MQASGKGERWLAGGSVSSVSGAWGSWRQPFFPGEVSALGNCAWRLPRKVANLFSSLSKTKRRQLTVGRSQCENLRSGEGQILVVELPLVLVLSLFPWLSSQSRG